MAEERRGGTRAFILRMGGGALAQWSDGFGRAAGGVLELSAKGPSRFSGSFGLTTGSGLRGYGATFGGTVINDRLSFFRTPELNQPRAGSSTLPPTSPKIDAHWKPTPRKRHRFFAALRKP